MSIFPLIWFQCDSASWQLPAGVVPAHRVAMDASLPWPEVLRPSANLYSAFHKTFDKWFPKFV